MTASLQAVRDAENEEFRNEIGRLRNEIQLAIEALETTRGQFESAAVADIRHAANEQAPIVFQAQQGVALDVAEAPAGGWVKVRHSDGQTGFVKINQVWGI